MSITINNASSMHDGTIHGWRVVCVVCGVLCISIYADFRGSWTHWTQMAGYDPDKDDLDEDNYELWTLWELDEALYDCVGDYYKSNKDEDGVELHENDSGVLSDYYDK